MIPFNKPYLTGKETDFIYDAVQTGKISGDGKFTRKCHEFFKEKYGFKECLLTTSCTDALEMAALLLNIQAGDEVIVPSFTFVSTANPFVLRGARIVFCDSRSDHPNMDEDSIEALITERTKVIVVVHYAGVACNMAKINSIARTYGINVVEDAAQAIHSSFNGVPLGTFGIFGTFSFHETKNVNCDEGGLLIVNDIDYFSRAEVIREKGTNRSAFFRGDVDKYNWVDVGSSFLPSDLNAAYLYAQLLQIDNIQARRRHIWNVYHQELLDLQKEGLLHLPTIPSYATNNAHMFYVLCPSLNVRTNLINYLKAKGIWSVFHYQSLHCSPFFTHAHDGRELSNSDRYSDILLRLPMYFELDDNLLAYVTERIREFFRL